MWSHGDTGHSAPGLGGFGQESEVLENDVLDQGEGDAPDEVDGPPRVEAAGALLLQDPLQAVPVGFVQVFVPLRAIKLHPTLHGVQGVAEGLGQDHTQSGGPEANQEFVQEPIVVALVESGVLCVEEGGEGLKRPH